MQKFLVKLVEVEANVRAKSTAGGSPFAENVPGPSLVAGQVKPKLGINYVVVTDAFLTALHLQDVQGVVVVQVAPGSAAKNAGLLPGDIISEINSVKLKSEISALPAAIGEVNSGQTVKFYVWRNGKKMEVSVTF